MSGLGETRSRLVDGSLDLEKRRRGGRATLDHAAGHEIAGAGGSHEIVGIYEATGCLDVVDHGDAGKGRAHRSRQVVRRAHEVDRPARTGGKRRPGGAVR